MRRKTTRVSHLASKHWCIIRLTCPSSWVHSRVADALRLPPEPEEVHQGNQHGLPWLQEGAGPRGRCRLPQHHEVNRCGRYIRLIMVPRVRLRGRHRRRPLRHAALDLAMSYESFVDPTPGPARAGRKALSRLSQCRGRWARETDWAGCEARHLIWEETSSRRPPVLEH